MNSALFERRRAEVFAELLDEPTVAVHRHRATERDLDPLVALAARVTSVRLPATPDPEFRDGLRAMLIATIERDGIGDTAAEPDDPARARRRTRARVAVLAGVVAGALTVSGVSAASGSAKPGDALYQVKRSTERAQLALAGSESSRGQLYLEFARVRLAEAAEVGPDQLPRVLLDMDNETRDGVRLIATAAVNRHDADALADIERFARAQRAALAGLVEGLPAGSRARAAESLRVLDRVDARVRDLRGAMDCGGPTGQDELGPVPDRCA